MYKEYDLTVNNKDGEYAGSIFGYVTEDVEQLKNFLEKNDYHEFDVKSYEGKRIGIITNLYVEEDERNNGYGTDLMEQILYFFEEEHSIDYLFLVSDGVQTNDFNLQKWYEEFNFEVVSNKFKCPLMLLSYI